MKIVKLGLSLAAISSLISFQSKPTDTEDMLLGTWKWYTVVNTTNNDTLGLEMLTMGMASEVRTQFREDHTYTESKNKLEGEGMSEKEGEWKLDNNSSILSLKAKEKWIPGKILKISADTLILEPRAPFALIMIRED